MEKIMTDDEIYNVYRDYKITRIVWFNDTSGTTTVQFPAAAFAESQVIRLRSEMVINFNINENLVITLDTWLPEFVQKDLVAQIRSSREDGNQYLWGV
jgi:hypothetical protein